MPVHLKRLVCVSVDWTRTWTCLSPDLTQVRYSEHKFNVRIRCNASSSSSCLWSAAAAGGSGSGTPTLWGSLTSDAGTEGHCHCAALRRPADEQSSDKKLAGRRQQASESRGTSHVMFTWYRFAGHVGAAESAWLGTAWLRVSQSIA